MAATMKRNMGFILFLAITLHGCGQGSATNGSSMAVGDEAALEVSAAPVTENNCMEKAPLDETPMTYCKALSDGSTQAVTLKPSLYVQDAETCVITVVDDGMKLTILEMGFEPCEV